MTSSASPPYPPSSAWTNKQTTIFTNQQDITLTKETEPIKYKYFWIYFQTTSDTVYVVVVVFSRTQYTILLENMKVMHDLKLSEFRLFDKFLQVWDQHLAKFAAKNQKRL